MMSFLSNFFGGDKSPLETYGSQLLAVNAFKDEVAGLSQEKMREEVESFKLKVKSLETKDEIRDELEEILPRVFALTREAAKRTIGQFHFDVQVVGGAALANKKIAEMKTGEGKTLTATLPLVLYALAGKGAHLVTVNDYLAQLAGQLDGADLPLSRPVGCLHPTRKVVFLRSRHTNPNRKK